MSEEIKVTRKSTKTEPKPSEAVTIPVKRVSTDKPESEKSTRKRFKAPEALKKLKKPEALKKFKKSEAPQKTKEKSADSKSIKRIKESKLAKKIDLGSPETLQKIFAGLGAIAAVLLVAIIVVLVIQKFRPPALDEEFFKSDETKSVISMTTEGSTSDTSHVQTFIVYDFEGDNVVGLKTYFEYTDAEAAAAALEGRKSQPEFENAELNDKYIVVTAKPESYQGLTASDVRQQEEAIKQFQTNAKKEDKKEDKKDDKKADKKADEK